MIWRQQGELAFYEYCYNTDYMDYKNANDI